MPSGPTDLFAISPILLTEAEARAAVDCARARMTRVHEHGWKSRAKEVGADDPFKNHALGAAGELAFAKWLGVPFVCTVDTFSAPDVAGYQVRTTRRRDLLKIHPKDNPAHLFVLVVGLGNRVFKLAGWISAEDGRVLGERRDPGSRGEAYFVPARELRPMVYLAIAHEKQLTTADDPAKVSA